jgi:chorismate mutase
MSLRGIRGATTCSADEKSILNATQELLKAMIAANSTLQPEDIASILFTVTSDLQTAYPAKAARLMGWTEVPLMDALEIDVPGGLPHCVRVLIHWNTELSQSSVHPVYLHDAVKLRPDLSHE